MGARRKRKTANTGLSAFAKFTAANTSYAAMERWSDIFAVLYIYAVVIPPCGMEHKPNWNGTRATSDRHGPTQLVPLFLVFSSISRPVTELGAVCRRRQANGRYNKTKGGRYLLLTRLAAVPKRGTLGDTQAGMDESSDSAVECYHLSFYQQYLAVAPQKLWPFEVGAS